jgi:membrane fusion protein (multidrug efflux system)
VVSKKPEIGTYVERGKPIMSLVGDGDVWVEANFKETQLTYLRSGQDATIEIDTYPGRKWHGTVQSISEATGAEFAVLPAQNATGNWVKVVQRVAVRVAIPRESADPPLRAGMSATVTVDTEHHRSIDDLLPWS